MSNRIYDAFDAVHAENQLKDSTKEYLFENVYSKKRSRSQRPIRYAAAVCCALLIFIFGSAGVYNVPVATISVDVNPSVEMKINLLDRVIDVVCLNSDAEEVTSDLSLANMKYEKAVTTLLDSEKEAGYLESDATVDIAVAGNSESRCNKISQNISTCTAQGYGNVNCSQATEEEVKAADEAGLSVGKYRAYLELKKLDPNVTVEDVKNMSMRQIRDKIEALSESSEETTVKTSNGYGKGKQNGAGVSENSSGNQKRYGSGNGKHSSNNQ